MVVMSLNKSLQVIKGLEENIVFYKVRLKALSGLIQFLAVERPLKMIKNASHFASKALYVFKIFKFLS